MKKLIPLVALLLLLCGIEACGDTGSRPLPETERPTEVVASIPDAERNGPQLTPTRPDAKRSTTQDPEPELALVPAPQNMPAPLSVRATCVDELGNAIEGVALTVVSLSGCPIAYSNFEGLAVLEFDRDLNRVGIPYPALKSAGAPIAVQLTAMGRTTQILFGPRLEELEQHDCGRVELLPAGTVVGRVVGSNGLPIVGAPVLPAGALPEFSEEAIRSLRVSGLFWSSLELGGAGTTTDFDGRFRAEGVTTQPVRLWSQQPGTYAAWSDPIRLEHAATLDIGTLTLDPLSTGDRIAGQILNADGSPSAGATIVCESLQDERVGPRTLTEADGNGQFLVPALEGVTHGLSAQHSTDVSLHLRKNDVLGGNLHVVLQFEQSEPEERATGTVAGRVLVGGDPAPFATLRSLSYGDSADVPSGSSLRRADANGQFALELPPGAARLQAQSSDGEFIGMSASYEVSTTQKVQDLVIELEAVSAIDGIVLAPPDSERSGIEFLATGPYGLVHKTSTRRDGSFEFEQLHSGPWRVARVSTRLFARGESSPEGIKPRELSLTAGKRARLEFDLRGSAQLEGRIAIGVQRMDLWSWHVAGAQGYCEAEGRFRVPAIARLGETRIDLGARFANSLVQVSSQVRLHAGTHHWSFEVETGDVELHGLPLDLEVPLDGSFSPVCRLRYEHPDGTVWEALPLTAKEGSTKIRNVPVGRVLVVREGQGEATETLAAMDVGVGETISFEWRD